MDDMPAYTSRMVKCSWILYIFLVGLRIVYGPWFPGYIHPDEFFQGGQELWFGCPPTIPWEFQANNALRSVVPLAVQTFFPLQVFASIRGLSLDELSGVIIWIIPRIWCSLLSIMAVDGSVWSLASRNRNEKEGVPSAVLILASAWPTLTMLNRPFSNSMETYLFALLMNIALRTNNQSLWKNFTLGTICAFGLFTRFTFVFFAIPVMLFHIWNSVKINRFLNIVTQQILATGLSFCLTVLVVVYLDSNFYGSGNQSITINRHLDSYVLTPWNSLQYNSKIENLSHHGLHPHWTHALVNMFILYGPLTLLSYLCIIRDSIQHTQRSAPESSVNYETTTKCTSSTIQRVCRWTILVGLACLSMAPHQEPRFLLPLIVPITLIAGGNTQYLSIVMIAVVALFNLILLVLFGMLHQGGVVPSLLATCTSLAYRESTTMLYFHTYMPPTFLTREIQKRQSTCAVKNGKEKELHEVDDDCSIYHGEICRDMRIVDLKGSDFHELRDALSQYLPCTNQDNINHYATYVYLVTPPIASDVDGALWSFSSDCSIPGYDCHPIWTYFPHITTEDFPAFDGSMSTLVSNLTLSIYEITCSLLN